MPSAALLARAASGAPVQAALTDGSAAVFADAPVEETVVHRVKSGESLSSIAKKYQTTVAKLKALNHLAGSVLKVGARLVVSTPQTLNAQQQ
jgi:LysM repeat protein